MLFLYDIFGRLVMYGIQRLLLYVPPSSLLFTAHAQEGTCTFDQYRLTELLSVVCVCVCVRAPFEPVLYAFLW